MLFVPAIHLPHGRELFKPLPYRPKQFRQAMIWMAERALLQCVPGDSLLLPCAPDGGYLAFLRECGLGTDDIHVCEGTGANFAEDILESEGAMDFIRSRAGSGARFYIHLEEEDEIAGKTGLKRETTHPALTRMFNTLYFLIRLEEDLGIAPPERVALRSSRLEEPLREMLKKHPHLFVRGNESCGGTQAYAVAGEADIAALRKSVARNRSITRYFASPFLDVSESWNAQYELLEAAPAFYGASRQTLEKGYAHKGNVGGLPPPEAVRGMADALAARLWEMGGRGMVGIDLMTSGGKVFPAEINARENTSTPVIAVQKKIGARFFQTFKAPVPRGYTFADFERTAGGELLFNQEKKRGAVPFHFKASAITGALDVAVFADTEGELRELVEVVERRFYF
ncbi:MAG: hypothetical protein HZA04_05470 [Nitrospinae bacterium]|nr:hypothetical protein [Nitrospinota bacterium]